MGVCTGKEFTFIRPLPHRRLSESSVCIPTALCTLPYSDIKLHYRFSTVIGKGSFGTVREAYRLDPPSPRPFAVKSIPKRKVDSEILRREMDIVQYLRHPNIVKCYSVFEDEKYVHIVMEKCTGGNIFERAENHQLSTEQQLSDIFLKICSAVEFLHRHHVCHRDIKAENVLFESDAEDSEVKLIDFGLARRFWAEKMISFVGSPYYMAPEVLKGGYGAECDVWGIGVLLFLMLVGRPPFEGEQKDDVFQSILRGKLDFGSSAISTLAKDLVQGMLIPDESRRLSIQEVMRHPWFSYNSERQRETCEKKRRMNGLITQMTVEVR